MKKEYLIVHKKLLPPYLDKVIEARNLLNNHEVDSISKAVKKVGISRNTYYKYKDYVYELKDSQQREAIISLILKDSPGTLSEVINTITGRNCNIVTISQAIPLNNMASVLMTIDISNLDGSIDKLITDLKKLKATKKVDLSAIE